MQQNICWSSTDFLQTSGLFVSGTNTYHAYNPGTVPGGGQPVADRGGHPNPSPPHTVPGHNSIVLEGKLNSKFKRMFDLVFFFLPGGLEKKS